MANWLLVKLVGILFVVAGFVQPSAFTRLPLLFEDEVRTGENIRNIESTIQESKYRLPNSTLPTLYDVKLTTKVHSGDLNFQGEVVITIEVAEANTKNVVIHARQLHSFEASLFNVADKTIKQLSTSYAADTEFLTLTPDDNSELVRGNIYKVSIKYKGKLREDNGGFYVSTYTNSAGKTVNMATTQFAPTDARHAFPCYDEPAKRANFTITINHDTSMKAISNMPEDTDKSSPGKTVFKQTPNMPTYLVAFIVSEFEANSGSLNELTQRVFSRNGTQTDQEFALLTGMQMISHLAKYYGVPYVLPKLDQVAIPDFAAGAMENWGLVTYREENLLYNSKKSTLSTQTKAANIIAHEYTHLWFGDLVTIKWWTWLWLKEGFANFFSYKAADEVYPEWDIMQMFIISEFQKALSLDGENKTRPMTHYVEKQKEIRSLYDTIAYSKSGAVLRMWQHALTDEVFRAGLNKYLTKNKFTGSEEDDFFDAISEAAADAKYQLPDSIHVMMKTWTNQGGVPLLTVKRNYDYGSFNITQTSFHNEPASIDSKLWYIPVNYATKNKSDFRNTTAQFYFKDRSVVVEDKDLSANEWLILNKQSTGYYRVNYDEKNWNLITDSLISNPNKIHTHNRASLLFDAYALSTTFNLQHSFLLRLLTFLRNEDQYAPWATANTILTTFDMFFKGDKHYPAFKAFVADLVGNVYGRLGIQFATGEHHFTNNVRTIAINLACMAGVQSCLDGSLDTLNMLVNKGIEIEPNLQSVIYCNSLRNAEDTEFEYVYNRLMNSQDQAERKILISSLGCARNPKHLGKFIKSSINTSNEVTLRSQERITLLNSAYSQSEVGLLVCIDFLFENHNAYAALTTGFVGSNPLDADIKGMSKYVVDSNIGEKLIGLVKFVKNHPDISADLETTVINNMQFNFDWMDSNQKPLLDWISDNYKISGASKSSLGSIALALTALYYITVLFI